MIYLQSYNILQPYFSSLALVSYGFSALLIYLLREISAGPAPILAWPLAGRIARRGGLELIIAQPGKNDGCRHGSEYYHDVLK